MKKGPKFCAATPGNFFEYQADTRQFTRRLALQEIFFDNSYEKESCEKSFK